VGGQSVVSYFIYFLQFKPIINFTSDYISSVYEVGVFRTQVNIGNILINRFHKNSIMPSETCDVHQVDLARAGSPDLRPSVEEEDPGVFPIGKSIVIRTEFDSFHGKVAAFDNAHQVAIIKEIKTEKLCSLTLINLRHTTGFTVNDEEPQENVGMLKGRDPIALLKREKDIVHQRMVVAAAIQKGVTREGCALYYYLQRQHEVSFSGTTLIVEGFIQIEDPYSPDEVKVSSDHLNDLGKQEMKKAHIHKVVSLFWSSSKNKLFF